MEPYNKERTIFIEYFNDYQANFGVEKTQELITHLLMAYSTLPNKLVYVDLLRRISANIEVEAALSEEYVPLKASSDSTSAPKCVTIEVKGVVPRRRSRKKPRKGSDN